MKRAQRRALERVLELLTIASSAKEVYERLGTQGASQFQIRSQKEADAAAEDYRTTYGVEPRAADLL